MNGRRLALLSVLGLLAWPVAHGHGQAYAVTGHELSGQCRTAIRLIEDPGSVPPESDGYAEAMLCFGFVGGAADTGAMLAELRTKDVAALMNCKPEGLTAEEGARLVVRHLSEKPEDANLPAAAVVLITLHNAFPCDAGDSEPAQ